MTTRVEGIQRAWGGDVDDGGYRTYTVVHRVISDTGDDGPATVLRTPGLPEPGDEWSFSDDYDPWTFCQWNKKPSPVGARDGERVLQWDVESVFSNKPPPRDRQRCQDDAVEDPLLEPAKIGGSYVKKTEEATEDRFGLPIENSAYEMIRGPQNEWDMGNDVIKIEQNVATPFQGYVLPYLFKNCLNTAPLWGFEARCVKLSSTSWERVFFGRCSVYYKRTLEFEVDARGFDRNILDEGTKVLNGHWDRVTGDYILDYIGDEAPSEFNPAHFIRYKDRNGENTRVVLNGHGVPSGVCVRLDTEEEDYWNAIDTNTVTQRYVSLFGPNVGNDLLNTAKWVAVSSIVPTIWGPNPTYTRGDMVTQVEGSAATDVFICLARNSYDRPPSGNWSLITGPTDRGQYNSTTSYGKGDLVIPNITTTDNGGDGCEKTVVGYRHVEKYDETDFLLLGIPTDF